MLQRKQRLARGQFLVEGPQAVREALAAGLVDTVFVTEAAAQRHPELVVDDSYLLAAEQLQTLADTDSPQGIVAIARADEVSLDRALGEAPQLVVICAQIRDPGNAGTVIRCADAFGADAVVLTESSVELTNPKVVRASVGSLFHLPIVTGIDLARAVDACRTRGMQILAADGGSADRLDLLQASGELAAPTAWILGNEAWGLRAEAAALADRSVGIPIWGRAESLNLATAASVCLYQSAAAQRAAHD
nr:RNA methyltransferase [Naumannella halotolerans]